MTEKQRYALSLLVFMGGAMGSADWYGHHKVHRNTTKSLIRKKWIVMELGEGFRITDAGRAALRPRHGSQ